MEKRKGHPNLGDEWRARVVWSSIPESYSHPLPLQTPVLPPTITDQIRLWELERDRLRFTEGEWLLRLILGHWPEEGQFSLELKKLFMHFIFCLLHGLVNACTFYFGVSRWQ